MAKDEVEVEGTAGIGVGPCSVVERLHSELGIAADLGLGDVAALVLVGPTQSVRGSVEPDLCHPDPLACGRCRTCAGHSGMAPQPLQTSAGHGEVVVAPLLPASEAARPLPRWHSVSSTREYERCPRRYRYAYVERLPQDRLVPIPWRVGSAVHAALEAAYQAKRQRPERPLIAGLPEALVALRHAWDTLELPHDDGRYREAGRQVERTLSEDVLKVGEVVGVELPLRASFTVGHRIAGFLDLLLRRDATTLEIVDHKVTARRASSSEIAADLQLNLYGALVRETWPDTITVRATLHYPTGPDLVSATLTDEAMAAARARVERTASLAAADTTFAPRPAAHCDHCPWRQRCPAG